MKRYDGPFDTIPGADLDEESRHMLLGEALAGLVVGRYDEEVLGWLGRQPTPVVRSVTGLIERARRLERLRKRPSVSTRRRREPGYVILPADVMQLIRGGLFG